MTESNNHNVWLWSVTEKNWQTLLKKNLWASWNNHKIRKLIKFGDKVVFYVKGTLQIQGIFTFSSDWYDSKKPIWDDEVNSIISMQEKPPIKEQMKNWIPSYNVMCNNDFVLLLKWTSNKSACVSPQTAEKLVERNWGVYRKDVHDLGYGEDPYTFFVGGATTISFEYDVSKYDETKLFKKIREKLSEHLKELGWSSDYNWYHMSIVKKSEGHFTLGVGGGTREDLLRDPLEKIEGVSKIEYHGQQV